MKHLESFAKSLPVAVAVYNIQTGQYRFVTKEIEALIGHTVESILEGGVEFVQSLIHEDDLQRINEENQAAIQYIQKNPDSVKSHWADFSYRVRNLEGNWVHVHTRGRVYSLDEKKNIKEILNFTFAANSNENLDFKELGKIALYSFDHFRDTLNHDLKGHIHVLEFLVNQLVEDSIGFENIPAKEMKEKLLNHSMTLAEVSTMLNNLVRNI
ncbi:MAG: PAS domain-containing protein [Halobacteriovoraceae bacterium]|nr:PAS domain-containing protein [Halobacteriovoraceae bacterium]